MFGIDSLERPGHARTLRPAITAAFFTALSASAGAQTTWFVDASAADVGTGASWSTAFKSLDSALLVAQDGDEVWVADGVYRPQKPSNPADLRSSTFRVPSGIHLYGGFAGNEISVDERTGLFESTVLSGDLGTLNDSSDNAYHVVTLHADSPVGTPPTFIDGFVISHGHADGAPGADQTGAGVWTFGNKPRLIHCTFRFNTAAFGAAVCVTNGTVFASECTFESNTATGGGGALLIQTAYGRVYNCTFRRNTATDRGGAVVLARQLGMSNVHFVNCLFHDNRAIDGGAVYLEGQGGGGQIGKGQGIWTNCTFAYNFATGVAGGLHADTGAGGSAVSTLQNCIVWNNRAPNSPQLKGPHSVSYSDVQGSGGGAPGNIDADPLFIHRTGSPRNLRLDNASPAIDAGNLGLLWTDYFDFDGDGDVDEPVSLDLDFGVRLRGARLDMGAYEY